MWAAGQCTEGIAQRQELRGQMHIPLPEPLNYEESPPASGSHRPMWACWGEYEYLPPTRWLHNLEHGGITILYNPCVESDVVDALRSLAKSIEPDEAGSFRWILTPYPDLPSAIAILSWRWVYSAECLREEEMREFIRQHYRKGPEDIKRSGDFSEGYLGR